MTKEAKMVGGAIVILAALLLSWYIMARQKGEEEQVVETPQSAVSTPIKVGFLHPLSGDAARYGEGMRNVARLAVEEINADGGVSGRPLELIVEDGKCNGKDAASAMQKLIDVDQVKVVVGGFCSNESLAAAPIAEQNKVALFSPGSPSPDLTGKSPYFMRNYPSDASQGQVLANLATRQGWKKVAFIQEQLDYPLGIYKAFSAQFEKNGGTIINEEFATTATDFRSSLAKLRAQKPDALFIDSQTAASGERVLKQVKELKWDIRLMITNAFAGDAKVVAENAEALEGVYTAEFDANLSNQKFQELAAAYQKTYDAELPFQSYAQTEYDAFFMLRDALAAVGEDGEQLAQWLRSVLSWEGASGSVTIGSDGDRIGGYTPKVIKTGKVESLE